MQSSRAFRPVFSLREQDDNFKSGLLFALGCYILWGFFPVYWKQLQHVDSLEILAHRMSWSLIFVLAVLAAQGKWRWLKIAFDKPREVLIYFSAASLLALNWGVYIWAVNAGYVVETALGYFINPLINVLFGRLFLGETLRRGQALSIFLAFCGVGYLTWSYGELPWIALTLAVSFATYGLLKKKATLGAIEGLSLETALLFLPAVAYLLFIEVDSQGAFLHSDARTNSLLAFSGVATALPLMFFAAALRRLSLTVIGLIQYMAPTIQFLLGVYLYNEPFSIARLIGFLFIWTGLVVFTIEGFVHRRTR